jgi:pyridoxine 4-dehydrogenase
MSTPNASSSGLFKIGDEITIKRLGYGAMRITGPGIWGVPLDIVAALRILKRLPDLGVNFIDTADSYGPGVSERLIHEALHPYTGLTIATKGGLMRPGPDQWVPNGKPEYLIAQANRSREILGVEKIDLWHLHRIDPHVPRDEQFAAIEELLRSDVVRHAGLSEVSVHDIKAAQKVFRVATVQNRYNLADRASEDVLNYCERNEIGFIPWYPLAAGKLARGGGILDRIASRLGATQSQIALAWMLKRSRVMLPIPGTSNVAHLEENIAAAELALSQEDFEDLDRAAPGA